MTHSDLEKRLCGASLDDVLRVGFIDDAEQPVRFRALLGVVYFEIGKSLLKFRTVGDTGTMAVTVGSTFENDFELDDDMVFAVASVSEQVLRDPDGKNALVALRLWQVSTDQGDLRCWAARMDLANGQQLFLDPTYHFGIRLGGVEQQEIWKENWPGASGATEETLRLSKS